MPVVARVAVGRSLLIRHAPPSGGKRQFDGKQQFDGVSRRGRGSMDVDSAPRTPTAPKRKGDSEE
jgi:hypothetical protein